MCAHTLLALIWCQAINSGVRFLMQHSRSLHNKITKWKYLPRIPTQHPLAFHFLSYQTVQKSQHCYLSAYKKDWKYLWVKYEDLSLAWEDRYYKSSSWAPQHVFSVPQKAVCSNLHSQPVVIPCLDFCIHFAIAQAGVRTTALCVVVTMTLTCEYLLKTSLVFSSSCAATLHHCTGGEWSLFSFTKLLSLSIAVKKKQKEIITFAELKKNSQDTHRVTILFPR